MPEVVYTIGHSTHSMEKLIDLLALHRIRAVGDVRSHPYSRFNPQFRKENLHAALTKAGISYILLGRELGARPEEQSCYVNGTVQYDRLAHTDLFQQGLERIVGCMRTHRVAVLCAEKDPLICHRAILISRYLVAQGVGVQHILADGALESHNAVLARLLEELGLSEDTLFRSRDALISEAYTRRGRQIAYT